jgi:hypothetical protein
VRTMCCAFTREELSSIDGLRVILQCFVGHSESPDGPLLLGLVSSQASSYIKLCLLTSKLGHVVSNPPTSD